jgi:hypothetical protein
VVSAKGLFLGLGDETTAFSAAVATGITVIFAGFLLTTTSTPPIGPPTPPPPGLPATSAQRGSRTTDPEPRSSIGPEPMPTPRAVAEWQ